MNEFQAPESLGAQFCPIVVGGHELAPAFVIAQHMRGERPVIVAFKFNHILEFPQLAFGCGAMALGVKCKHFLRRIQESIVYPKVRNCNVIGRIGKLRPQANCDDANRRNSRRTVAFEALAYIGTRTLGKCR